MLLFSDGLLYMPTTVDVTRQSSEIEVVPVPQVSPLNDDNVTSDRDIQTNLVNLTIYVGTSCCFVIAQSMMAASTGSISWIE